MYNCMFVSALPDPTCNSEKSANGGNKQILLLLLLLLLLVMTVPFPKGAYYLTENFGNSGWKVNGKVFFRKFQPKIKEYVLR